MRASKNQSKAIGSKRHALFDKRQTTILDQLKSKFLPLFGLCNCSMLGMSHAAHHKEMRQELAP